MFAIRQSAVGRALLPAVLVQEYEAALPDLQEWLRATAADDADDSCRQLAAACHAIFGKSIRSELTLDEQAAAAAAAGSL